MRQTREHEAERRGNGQLSLTFEGMAWLAAAMLLGTVGWIKSINLVLLLAYLMAILLVINGLLAWLQVRRVAAAREPDPPPFAREETTVRVTARNRGKRPATVSVEHHAGERPTGWLVHRLPPGASTACKTRRTFATRGRFPSALRIASGFPFGLVRYEQPVAAGEFDVLPAPGEVEADGLRAWLLRQVGGDGRARKVLRRVTTEQADVRGVRPYRPGDPIRSIHWRSSARRGELMVREYDAAPSPELILVVEPWLPVKKTVGDLARLEAALSMAVSIARSWSSSFGTRVTVVIAGEAGPAASGATDLSLREALAPLAATQGGVAFEPPAPVLFERTLARTARLLISSRRNSPFATALYRSTNRPFLAVSPGDLPTWYHPPGTATGPGPS